MPTVVKTSNNPNLKKGFRMRVVKPNGNHFDKEYRSINMKYFCLVLFFLLSLLSQPCLGQAGEYLITDQSFLRPNFIPSVHWGSLNDTIYCFFDIKVVNEKHVTIEVSTAMEQLMQPFSSKQEERASELP